MNVFWYIMAGLCIAAQLPHAYWSIDDFSIVKNKAVRTIQNMAFCIILSFMTMGFVIEGLHWHALALSVLEVVINVYYFQRGMAGTNADTRKKKWLRHVLAVAIPALVFVSSLMIR